MVMEEEKTTFNRTNLIFGIILAVAIIGIVIISILTYLKTVSDEKTIFTLREDLVALQNQLESAQDELTLISGQVDDADSQISSLSDQEASDVSSLQDELSTASNQISSLTNQIDSALLQVSNLQVEVAGDADLFASIQTQLSSVNSQLSSLSDTTVDLQDTLTSLDSTVDSLISEVNALQSSASTPTVLFSSHSISQSYDTQTLLCTYTPTYNGYIYISGTSNSTTGYLRVTNNTTATYTDYAFGTGTTVTTPVIGGYNYSIRFGNTESSGTVTATLSATYYPTSSSSTHSAALFTSQPVSQTYSTQTLLYTFTPTYSGYISISGTSSSTTGYIRVTNNTTATYTDYSIGTSGTIYAPITSGYSYSIQFGNTESSGTVTAVLSAVYYY